MRLLDEIESDLCAIESAQSEIDALVAALQSQTARRPAWALATGIAVTVFASGLALGALLCL